MKSERKKIYMLKQLNKPWFNNSIVYYWTLFVMQCKEITNDEWDLELPYINLSYKRIKLTLLLWIYKILIESVDNRAMFGFILKFIKIIVLMAFAMKLAMHHEGSSVLGCLLTVLAPSINSYGAYRSSFKIMRKVV